MKLDKIIVVARELGVKPGKLKKAELIAAIQVAEGNNACFDTGQASECGQTACLWREDCR